jgi:proton-translocating NADH-quinone oxidoreductase chain M
MDNLSLIL